MIAPIDASDVRRLAERFAPAPSDPNACLIQQRPSGWRPRKIRIRIHRSHKASAIIMQREFERIMPILANQFGVPVDLIFGRGRKQRIVDARLMAYAYLRERGYSLPLIAKSMSGRDHGTVVKGLVRWQSHMDTLPEFKAAWERFSKAVQQ